MAAIFHHDSFRIFEDYYNIIIIILLLLLFLGIINSIVTVSVVLLVFMQINE